MLQPLCRYLSRSLWVASLFFGFKINSVSHCGALSSQSPPSFFSSFNGQSRGLGHATNALTCLLHSSINPPQSPWFVRCQVPHIRAHGHRVPPHTKLFRVCLLSFTVVYKVLTVGYSMFTMFLQFDLQCFTIDFTMFFSFLDSLFYNWFTVCFAFVYSCLSSLFTTVLQFVLQLFFTCLYSFFTSGLQFVLQFCLHMLVQLFYSVYICLQLFLHCFTDVFHCFL